MAAQVVASRAVLSSTELVSYIFYRRMPSSGMLRHVALVRTDVSEKLSSSIIRVTRIGELGMLAGVRADPEVPGSILVPARFSA
jgi:hypothetical protein